MTPLVNRLLGKIGLRVSRIKSTIEIPAPICQDRRWSDFDDFTDSVISKVEPYTRTSKERISETIQAVRYINHNKIPGALVECGVWMGGSIMAMIETLKEVGDFDREIYLYDTFEGMSKPTEEDISFDGSSADAMLASQDRENFNSIWCKGPLTAVKEIIYKTNYPKERLHFVQGKVENTLPDVMPDKIALMRLDTDWYESTAHELNCLYPILSPWGILIIDDYGHWKGARKAVDEYFSRSSPSPFLARTDYTGRVCVKPSIVSANTVGAIL